jgi:uncharacterized Zn-finger protein
MNAEAALRRTEQLEKVIMKKQTTDKKTKWMVSSYFREVRRLINYQIPMPPTDISEDGREFACPRCSQRMAIEDGWYVTDFIFCPYCGQRYKGDE